MSRFTLSSRTWAVAGVGLAAVAIMTVLFKLHVGGDPGAMWVSDVGEPLIVLLSAGFVLVSARVLGFGGLGKPWLLIGLGVLSFGIGDVVWTAIELGQRVEVPYPGPPDVFYVALYPLVGLGLVLAVRNYRGLVDLRRPIIEAAILTAALCVLVYVGFLQPYVLSENLPQGQALLTAFYPLADVVFALGPAVAVALVVGRLGGGRLAWPWWAVIVGVVSFAVGDLGYAYLSARGLYTSGSLTDSAWSFAAVAIAVGASLAWDLARPDSWRH